MDEKLTDSEIVKALECCVRFKQICPETCPMVNVRQCKVDLRKNTLALINRQQAENERSKDILICFMGALSKVRNIDDIESISVIPLMTELNKGIRAEIKAEAYKEFAERLCEDRVSNDPVVIAAKCLLKEMAGENND